MQGIFSLEAMINEEVASFPDFSRTSCFGDPIKSKEVTLPVEIADEFPLAKAKLKETS
jgi:hypothetical protein